MRLVLIAILIAVPAAAQTAPALISEQGAYRASLWGTVAPVAAGVAIGAGGGDPTSAALLISAGMLFGPALGYGEAGLGGRGLRGVGVRAGLTLATVMASIGICGMDCVQGQTKYDVASWVSIGGAGLVTAAAVYDIARLRHNIRQKRVSVTPIYMPNQHSLGLGIGLTF